MLTKFASQYFIVNVIISEVFDFLPIYRSDYYYHNHQPANHFSMATASQ